MTKKQRKFNILFINDVTKWYTEMQCTLMHSIDIYMNRLICLHFTHPYKIFTLTRKLYEGFIYNEEKNGSHIFYKLICVEMSKFFYSRLIDYAFRYIFFFKSVNGLLISQKKWHAYHACADSRNVTKNNSRGKIWWNYNRISEKGGQTLLFWPPLIFFFLIVSLGKYITIVHFRYKSNTNTRWSRHKSYLNASHGSIAYFTNFYVITIVGNKSSVWKWHSHSFVQLLATQYDM